MPLKSACILIDVTRHKTNKLKVDVDWLSLCIRILPARWLSILTAQISLCKRDWKSRCHSFGLIAPFRALPACVSPRHRFFSSLSLPQSSERRLFCCGDRACFCFLKSCFSPTCYDAARCMVHRGKLDRPPS
jgi:hypothetical protein